jgi:hypothetical protein
MFGPGSVEGITNPSHWQALDRNRDRSTTIIIREQKSRPGRAAGVPEAGFPGASFESPADFAGKEEPIPAGRRIPSDERPGLQLASDSEPRRPLGAANRNPGPPARAWLDAWTRL